jgi:hypothetical protein
MVQLMSETKNYLKLLMIHHQRQESLKDLSKLLKYGNKLNYQLSLLTGDDDYLKVGEKIKTLENDIYKEYSDIENNHLNRKDTKKNLNSISENIDKKISNLELEFEKESSTLLFERKDKKVIKFKNQSDVI